MRRVTIEVLHVDQHMVVVNKPTGLLSVPGRQVPGGPDKSDCVGARVSAIYDNARIVHRLDRDTSGVMVLGRGAEAHRRLSIQFQERETEKVYIADVAGRMSEATGEVNLPIRKDMDNPPCQVVDFEQGRPSLTRWMVIGVSEMNGQCVTRVELRPLTGRSHQLRMHMKEIGHAILGDDLYSSPEVRALANRLHLHATSLTITHPDTGERMTFISPCPF